MAEPQKPDLRLSPADQVLINAAIVLATPTVWHLPDRQLALDCVAEAMGRGNPDHPFMGPVIVALQAMQARAATKAKGYSARDLIDLGDALARLAKWRLGGALDALRATEGVVA